MPHRKSRKINNQQNKSSILEPSIETRPNKQSDISPSLNNVPKQEQ